MKTPLPLGVAAVVPPVADDDRIRALAAEILARPEYARWRPRSLAWLEQLRQWIMDFFRWSGDLAVTAPVLYWTMVAVLLLIGSALLVHVVISLRAALAQPRAGANAGAADDDPHLLERAEGLAGRGLFLEAARYVQLAAIDLLIRRRVLELSRADANRILRRRLADALLPPAECRELTRLLDRLETLWFRDRTEDRELYESWRSLYTRLDALPEPV